MARAPGRVNLIGEHTDYNDGFVLPMAIPHATWMAARRRDDDVIRLWSEGHPAAELSTRTLDERVDDWSVYVQGVARMLADDGIAVHGFDAALATDIPVGASLSSSAALELVTATGDHRVRRCRVGPRRRSAGVGASRTRACRDALRCDGPADLLDGHRGPRLAHRLPQSGDRPRSAARRTWRWSCWTPGPVDSWSTRPTPNAGPRASGWPQALGVDALRDTTADAIADAPGLDATDRRRAQYVVAENDRTLRRRGRDASRRRSDRWDD